MPKPCNSSAGHLMALLWLYDYMLLIWAEQTLQPPVLYYDTLSQLAGCQAVFPHSWKFLVTQDFHPRNSGL